MQHWTQLAITLVTAFITSFPVWADDGATLFLHAASTSGAAKKVDVMIVRNGHEPLWKAQTCNASDPCDFVFGSINASILLGMNTYVSVRVSGKDEYCCVFSNKKTNIKRYPNDANFREDLFRFIATSKEVKFDRYFGQIFVKIE